MRAWGTLALPAGLLFAGLLLGAAPAGSGAPGRVFHVAPGGDDRHPGSAASPWKSVARAARAARAGDTVIFHAGVYRESLIPAHSGTGESSRIVFRAAPGEDVVLDGGTGKLTGWSHEGAGIYRRGFSGPLYGVFQDTYETAGKHTCLWNMDIDEYGSNPNRDLHGFDPGHDYYNGTEFKKHDEFSQYKYANGVLRVRTRDGRHPEEHNVRGSALAMGIDIRNKSYITVEGLKFRHYKNFVFLENAPHTRIKHCDFRYAGYTGVWMAASNYSEILGCVIQGGGSWIGHYEDNVQMKGTIGARWEGNDISYGGHSGFFIRGGSEFVLRGNHIHDCGGSLLTMYYDADRGLFEENVLARGPYRAETSVHRVPHAALQLAGGSNNVFRRNLFTKSGFGVTLSCDERQVTNGNQFYHNTIYGNEWDGIQLQGYTASNKGRLNNNVFKNNIVVNSGLTELRLDLVGGETGDFWGNRFENNLFFGKRLNPWGSHVNVAEAERRWPVVFRSNIEADPLFVDVAKNDFQLRAGSPALDRGTVVGLAHAGRAPDLGAHERPESRPAEPAAPASAPKNRRPSVSTR